MARLATTLAIITLPVMAIAADPPDASGSNKNGATSVLKSYSTDLSIPDSPGLSIVGLGTDTVIRPSTPRQLGMAIVQGRNESGALKQGFALDMSPLKLFRPEMSRQEYEASPFVVRPLWNSQISFGVGNPLNDSDKSTRYGIGFSSVLWRKESSDPLLNKAHGTCLSRALFSDLPTSMPKLDNAAAKPSGGEAKDERAVTAALKKCYSDLENATWNASAIMFGVARSTVSGRDPTLIPDATTRGYWLSFNYGFESSPSLQQMLQLTASYRRLRDEIVTDPADKSKFAIQDSDLIGAKLYARTDLAHLFIETSRKRTSITGRDTEATRLLVLGAEKKLANNMWLTLAIGTKHGGSSSNPTYVSTGLKFGFDESGLIKP
jgi:hypothetical protein